MTTILKLKHLFCGILLLLACSLPINGALTSVDVVKEFSNHLEHWSGHKNSFSNATDDYSPRIALNELLDTRRFRLDTKQINALAIKYMVPTSKTYDVKIFNDILVDAISNGTDAFITNIQYVPEDERDPRYTEYETVSCQFHFSGINPSSEACAFILSDNDQILKITPYSIKIDRKSGRKRMEVNLSDLEVDDDERSYGFGYNYNKLFPIGVGGHITSGPIYAGVEVGFNRHRPNVTPYTTRHNDITDLCNYKISAGKYLPAAYATFSMGYFAKYVAISYGFGVVVLEGDNITDEMSTKLNTNGTLHSQQSRSSMTDRKTKFLMRPNIHGFIPCGKGFSITLSVSYLWSPSYKPVNSFDFGIGIKIPLDD